MFAYKPGEFNMRVLVTGGAGFIGSNFVHYILNSQPDIKITVLDLLTYAGNMENLKKAADNPRFCFYQGDIRDEKFVKPIIDEVDIVINFAAESHVDRSIIGAAEFISTNIQGTYILLEAARQTNVKRFIQISTDEVYGSCAKGQFTEESILNPSSPYAASKGAADILARSFYTTYDLPVLITRSTNNYGPFQYPEKMIPLFLTNAIAGKPFPLYGDGLHCRDWLHVEDNCRAIECVMLNGEPGSIYNIGAGTDITNLELAQKLLELLGKPNSFIRHVEDRRGHDRRYAVSIDKIRALGWEPRVVLEEGLKRTVRWYFEHEEWWRNIKELEPAFQEFYEKYYKARLT